MSDDRIERALRAGPPDEPAWAPGRFAGGPPPRRGHGRTGRLLGGVGSVALIVVLALGVVIGRVTDTRPVPTASVSGDLAAQLHMRGVIRIAVTPTFPQLQAADGTYQGFDVDVAREIGRRLGLRVRIVVAQEADIVRGDWAGRWDIALGTIVTTRSRLRSIDLSAPYAYWPAWVSVATGLPIASPGDLSGRRICVTEGSFPAAWLAGTLDIESPVPVATPPLRPDVVLAATEGTCLHDQTVFGWDATITDRTTPDILALRARTHVLVTPAFVEPVGVAFDRSGPDPSSILADVDRAIAAMRADGTLVRLSHDALGVDLSVVPGS